MKNKVILVGGFYKAKALAESLVNSGYLVTVINKSYADCMKIAENDKLKVIQGDGTKAYVLEDAQTDENDIAIALTKRDEDNLVISQLCKKKFGVKKTISLVNDSQKANFFYKMGVDFVACYSNIITNILEQQAFMDDMATVLPLGEGNICIAEVRIGDLAPSIGKKVWELNLPKEVIIGCILRGEYNLVPRGETLILSGDVVILISSKEHQVDAIRVMTGR